MRSIVVLCLLSLSTALLPAVDQNIVTILERDSFTVRSAIHEADDKTAMAIVRAIPAVGRDDLFTLAVDLLDSPRSAVVEAAINAVEKSPTPFLAENLQQLRDLLAHSEPRIRWLAARFAGEVRDDHAIEGLIALLRDEPKVAKAAHESLVSIFHADLGMDPSSWEAHYLEWLEVEEISIPTLVDRLDSTSDRNEQLKGLHRLILLRSHRHAVGEILADYAQSHDPQVAALAVSGMRNLGGVAVMKGTASESMGNINDLLAQAEEAAVGPRKQIIVAQATTDDPGTVSTSQIMTVLALFAVGLAGAFAFRSSLKTRGTETIKRRSITKAISQETERIVRNLKRFDPKLRGISDDLIAEQARDIRKRKQTREG